MPDGSGREIHLPQWPPNGSEHYIRRRDHPIDPGPRWPGSPMLVGFDTLEDYIQPHPSARLSADTEAGLPKGDSHSTVNNTRSRLTMDPTPCTEGQRDLRKNSGKQPLSRLQTSGSTLLSRWMAEMGFPGNLQATVCYTLHPENELESNIQR